jgi:GTPase SAR1 family protein
METRISPQERLLKAVEQVAEARGDRGILSEAGETREILRAGRFNVALIGQFKRGKSSLINALLQRELLPADVTPLTSAITVIQSGSAERATVNFENGRQEDIALEEITRYVSEEGNPRNAKRVRAVVVELPHPLLAGGLRLVDTPGIGSVFLLNSEVTRLFLPKIDVALVILGCDPPITGEELAMIHELVPHAAQIVYVINKVDLAAPETIEKAESFTRRVLGDTLGQEIGSFTLTSAKRALQGEKDPGVCELQENLKKLSEQAGMALAQRSAARGAKHLALRLLQQIELEQAALLAPMAELNHKISRFQLAMRDIRDLALAIETRLQKEPTYDPKVWETEKNNFVLNELKRITSEVERVCQTVSGSGSQLRQVARDCAREQTRISVEAWLAKAKALFDQQYQARSERMHLEINRLVERVSEAAASCFGVAVPRFELPLLQIPRREIPFEFIERKLALDINDWLIPLLDLFSPRPAVIRRSMRSARSLAQEWLATNLYNIDEHLVDWMDSMVRQLFAAMNQRLEALVQDVLTALETGQRRRQEGEQAIQADLALLQKQRSLLDSAAADLVSESS